MPANIGNQTVSILYYSIANSSVVNKRHKGIREVGIYSGGHLSIVDSSNAQLSPLICEITDGTHQVRIETASTVNKGVAPATPYIILRWTYSGAVTDYMEILALATPGTNDLVVGKCTFTGGGALQGFNYSERTTPNVFCQFLKVIPTETPGLSVRILPGVVRLSSVSQTVADQTISLAAYAVAGGTVYVYVNDIGGISVSDDEKDYGGKALLGEVILSPGHTQIVESDITDARVFLDVSPTPVTTVLTANSTLSDTDQIARCNNTVAITVKLPSLPAKGRFCHIKKINVGDVIVDGNGNTIDGQATQRIRGRYDSMFVVFDGISDWGIY